MIKDVKGYLNTVTARLSNAFKVQDFDLEEESEFWALAAEHLSRKTSPTFRDMAGWIDLLFRAPVHLVYVKEGDKLKLFRQHVVSENLEFLYRLVDDEAKSSKNKQQIIREFEDRLANIESKIQFYDDFKLMGMASFTIGQCQHLPLFKDDEFWGIYCVGPYVYTPETIVPRLSIITRILTSWLVERYQKQSKLKYGEGTHTETNRLDTEKEQVHVQNSARFLIKYIINNSSAAAGLLSHEKNGFKLIQGVDLSDKVEKQIQSVSVENSNFYFQQWIKDNSEELNLAELRSIEKYPIGDSDEQINLYLLFFDSTAPVNKVAIDEEIEKTLVNLVHFKFQSSQFVEQLLETYYSMLRSIEKRNNKSYHHTPRIYEFADRFADLFGLKTKEKELLLKTARFHDIGYLASENSTMGTEVEHPQMGRKILRGLSIEKDVVMGIATHHEWIDGSGTPAGAKAEQIPWTGKIIGIIEFMVQFIENKLDKQLHSDKECKEELVQAILNRSGKQFDMLLVPTVIELINSMEWEECCEMGVKNDE